jgi:nucleotide-binding universal stress UspA family protein
MYQNILLTVDLDDEASWIKALPAAVAQAKASRARLHVATVVPDFGMPVVRGFFPEGFEGKVLAEVKEKLKAFCDAKVPSEINVKRIVKYGNVYQEILAVAEEIGCGLIVIGAHRPELKDYLLGPNAARVVRHASCSVLVVRN